MDNYLGFGTDDYDEVQDMAEEFIHKKNKINNNDGYSIIFEDDLEDNKCIGYDNEVDWENDDDMCKIFTSKEFMRILELEKLNREAECKVYKL